MLNPYPCSLARKEVASLQREKVYAGKWELLSTDLFFD